ncbi:glycosyltransferase family 2 protein [Flavobacterium sp.]|uniref:glycosyltransferase family 2 protein n=1 Tax=Flavobacterium sp. TaxID=239 RepID=UPI00262238F6|nr:glycosyltransferase family 2 protein [Flavobacterium sp.]
MPNKVYILLLNYNGFLDTIECLESLLKLNNDNFQIIVVDNSETPRPFENLVNWALGNFEVKETLFERLVFPLGKKPLDFCTTTENRILEKELKEKIVFVKANQNNGFAAGNNIALQYILKFGTPDSYIWLLNNDTVVDNDALSIIMKQMGLHQEEKSIYGTPLVDYYNTKTVQSIGGVYNKITGLSSHFGEGKSKEDFETNFDEVIKTIDYPIGASMLIKIHFLRELRLLSEDYFLFFEELDWVYRAKAIGGKVSILNYFGVFHKQGTSTKSKFKEKKAEFIDLISLNSRILFARKFNRANLPLIQLSILTLTLGKRVLQGNLKIIPKIIRLVFKGGVTYDENFYYSIGYKKIY